MGDNGTVGAMPNMSVIVIDQASLACTYQNTCSGWWHDP